MMIIKLPSLLIHSSNLNVESLNPYLQNLPVKLPESVWTCRKSNHNFKKFLHTHIIYVIKYIIYVYIIIAVTILGTQSFPWTLSLVDFHCYTLEQKTQKNFIKKVTLNATIALTTKTAAIQSNTLTALSICVHIDNSPILISLSEEQVLIIILIINLLFK